MDKKLDKSATWKMFNKIAGTYDLINRILSLGIDVKWRKKVAKFFPKKEKIRLLDLGTGTGDFILALVNELGEKRFEQIVGIDMAQEMLDRGDKKMISKN